MTENAATDAVRTVFAEIHGHPRRDLVVPHGFEVDDIEVEERRNPFAPEVLRHWRVAATLRVPVLYSPDSSRGIVRASLPAHRENLDALREWVAVGLRTVPARRAELRWWRVTPGEPPAPYLPNGEPNGPPADWTVTAVIDVH